MILITTNFAPNGSDHVYGHRSDRVTSRNVTMSVMLISLNCNRYMIMAKKIHLLQSIWKLLYQRATSRSIQPFNFHFSDSSYKKWYHFSRFSPLRLVLAKIFDFWSQGVENRPKWHSFFFLFFLSPSFFGFLVFLLNFELEYSNNEFKGLQLSDLLN